MVRIILGISEECVTELAFELHALVGTEQRDRDPKDLEVENQIVPHVG